MTISMHEWICEFEKRRDVMTISMHDLVIASLVYMEDTERKSQNPSKKLLRQIQHVEEMRKSRGMQRR
jgi:hypothetical protein